MKRQKWIKQKDDTQNSVAALQNFTAQLGVRVTPKTVARALRAHPDYPSLAALSETLHGWKVDNLAVRLGEEDLAEVSYPAIAHLLPERPAQEVAGGAGPTCGTTHQDSPRFVVATDINAGQATYLDMATGWHTDSRADFLRQWSGIMLLAEPRPGSGDPGYAENRRGEVLAALKAPMLAVGVGVLALLLAAWGVVAYPAVATWLPLVATKLAGGALAAMLVLQTVDKHHALAGKICGLGSGDGKKASACAEGVLESPAAKLFGWLSMAEVGAFYFAGGFLALAFGLFSAHLGGVLWVLAVLNALALPYTFFSVYYQWRVAKQWCTLCLGTQAVLWLELAAVLPGWHGGVPAVPFAALAMACWGFLPPMLAWAALKHGIGLRGKIAELERAVAQYRRRPEVLKRLVSSGRRAEVGTLPQEVVLGNPQAAHTVTIFTNPFCGPCQQAHHQLDRLLDTYRDGVRVQVRFAQQGEPGGLAEQMDTLATRYAALAEDAEARADFEAYYGATPPQWRGALERDIAEAEARDTVALSLLALAAQGDTRRLHQAMQAWYDHPNPSVQGIAAWKKRFAVADSEAQRMRPALAASAAWAREAGIAGTPTLFVGGHEYDGELEHLADLKYYFRVLEADEQAVVAPSPLPPIGR